MKISLLRYKNGDDSTGGLLYADGLFHCYTCEDEYRKEKVEGETRIPAGTYEIKLRKEGGMHGRYGKKFPWHRGMLWLQDVPNFEWVYIHIGNDDDDTLGCILVGELPNSADNYEASVSRSTDAYKRLAHIVYETMDEDERVFIEVGELSQKPIKSLLNN